jgi:hypothetical protein
VSLHQGVHHSEKSGEYHGNGEYKISMKDGGNGRSFEMHFQLTSLGGGKFELKRKDCGDAPTVLENKGDRALRGGDYTLNF